MRVRSPEANRAVELAEKWASDEFRSVNGQIEWMLHQKLTESGRLKKAAPDQEDTKFKKDKE